MLEVEGLYAHHGHGPVLAGLSLRVDDGEFVAVTGNNGAGKTTLLRTISGLHKPERGRVTVLGRSPAHLAPEHLARAGVGHVPEGRRVFGSLSVTDNLAVGAVGLARDERLEVRARVYEMFPRLAERATQRAGTLSGGEQQMLAIARALMGRPRLLMLDEPSLGLAPAVTAQTLAHLRRIRTEWGCTLLLVEQDQRLVQGVADRTLRLTGGLLHPDVEVVR
ncbi:ABC transporter ATP-binding protein [Actinoallomurus bryophytorum]|uniref:Amino acid/amide ABC transporter ATP-binding protein 2 (HAAT family) n=1 Tax=Actinoallomurus bryophytorum TaxID=1490222 RepID=A0A543C1J3_9ACTN|nr:ABC transporter ATP-binding protein [Actinoallomurus bryophytorum]TQL90942.1 amino acid/amide ABC transporter ATP-binding protein 2 (HAAT family) [Actinoallomurus bryophytorum]